MRRWHHQLTHLHIHTDWSRNVSWKFANFQNFITSLFFNRFSSDFHCYVQTMFTLSSEIKLDQLRTSPLIINLFSILLDSWNFNFWICKGELLLLTGVDWHILYNLSTSAMVCVCAITTGQSLFSSLNYDQPQLHKSNDWYNILLCTSKCTEQYFCFTYLDSDQFLYQFIYFCDWPHNHADCKYDSQMYFCGYKQKNCWHNHIKFVFCINMF